TCKMTGTACASSHKDDFARETFSVPVQMHVAPLVASYHDLHHMGAKALARWWIDGRTSRLRPAEHDTSICRARPLDANLTFGDGKSTMLRRIGRQLVHGHRYGLCQVRLQHDSRPVNLRLHPLVSGVRR